MIKRTKDIYKSVIPPPQGYTIVKTELLEAGDGPTRDEEEIYRAVGLNSMDFLDDMRILRTIVRAPDGKTLYTSSIVESVVDLCKKPFWEEFWKHVVLSDGPADKLPKGSIRKRIDL